MAQGGTEQQRQIRRDIVADNDKPDRDDRLARRDVRRDCPISQMAGKDADFASAIMVFDMRRQLVMYLEPAEQQKGSCQKQMIWVTSLCRAEVHGKPILVQHINWIKPEWS